MPNGPSVTHTVVPAAVGGPPRGDGLADGLGVRGPGVPAVGVASEADVVSVAGWVGGDAAAELVSGVPTFAGGGAQTVLRVLPEPPVPGSPGPGDRLAVPVPCRLVAPALGAGMLACAAPMRPDPAAVGVWMILMETADTSRNPITAAERTMTGTAAPAGWVRTMARAWPNAISTRSAISAAASGTAGSLGLSPIRPCWRSRRSVAARWAWVSPGSR